MKNFSKTTPDITQPFILGHPAFRQKPIVLQDKPTRWRGIADKCNLSQKARLRLEWMIFYETVGDKDAYVTAKHFSIAPKTFYKWYKRFDNGKVKLLEDQSKKPINTRKWEVTPNEECRIMKLRKAHMYWGKKKIVKLYFKTYGEKITPHKVQLVINAHNLYPDKAKTEKQRLKLKRAKLNKKKRIQELEIKDEHWFLVHLDTIVIYWGSIKRYILTACDHHGKIAYARMYTTKSSRSAKDFLYRLHYLIDADIINIQTDNGSEFYHEFEQALKQLEIEHYFSRPRTPKDNSIVEKFNQTLEQEWLDNGNFTPNIKEFNQNITKWIEEYNFIRPHQSLDYMTPYEYLEYTLQKQSACRQTRQKLLPMYSDSASS